MFQVGGWWRAALEGETNGGNVAAVRARARARELEPLIVILECYNLKQNWDCISRALMCLATAYI